MKRDLTRASYLLVLSGLLSPALGGIDEQVGGATAGTQENTQARYGSGFNQQRNEAIYRNNPSANINDLGTSAGNRPTPKENNSPFTFVFQDPNGNPVTARRLEPRHYVDLISSAEQDGNSLRFNPSTNTYRVFTPAELNSLAPANNPTQRDQFNANWRFADPPATPPQNPITVVDTQRWNNMTSAQRDAAVVYRDVARIIVETWKVLTPVYQNVYVAVYPCCCYRWVSLLVRYDVQERSQTRVEWDKVPAGADYPQRTVYVNRGIVYQNGSPQYSTEIPQLCQFTYGPNVTMADLYPVAPIRTNADDQLTSTGWDIGSNTTVQNGSITANARAYQTNSENYNGFWYNGRYINSATSTSGSAQNQQTANTTTYRFPVTTEELVNPNQVTTDRGRRGALDPLQPTTLPDTGQGINRHPGDSATVRAEVAIAPRGPNEPSLENELVSPPPR